MHIYYFIVPSETNLIMHFKICINLAVFKLKRDRTAIAVIGVIACGGFFYLSVIIDAFTKQALAHVLSPSLELDFVLKTVNTLIEKHGISFDSETLIHSDQGCHYTSKKFRQIVSESNLRQSMSRRGNCWDNAPQESFFGHMKDEIGDAISQANSFDEAKAIIDDWMDYYNKDRGQWSLSKLTPNEFYDYYLTGIYPLISYNKETM